MLVFGTRPELIKMLPIIREAGEREDVELITVMTSQHTDLVRSLAKEWAIPVDYDLEVMKHAQSLNDVISRVVGRIDRVLEEERPDVVLVQGDTSSAFGSALAAWQRQIPVGHVEAGLRTASIDSPFPEEANRRLISRIASFHFAPTLSNKNALLAEKVPAQGVFLTGNTVVDSIRHVMGQRRPSKPVASLISSLKGRRIIVLTTHRRESFGSVMCDRLKVLRRYVEERPDISLVFPVHPNPQVKNLARAELSGSDQIHLVEPLDYPDFLHVLAASWVILSDSGGIQEEAPSLGKPLLILRDETERPEAVSCGIARLVGQSAQRLQEELLELDCPKSWATKVGEVENPFGRGNSAARILDILQKRQTVARAVELAAAGTVQ
ncbi:MULTISPECIES: non-hydrolyzing UDP-N-acetylglucosamine 2-epimerase [unclassified Ruegeria]|nr:MULTISPECIES: UDP-N-acetylglucosamine 2-epimerase (non-hydrolyzing) [unclassified Ruegeria]